MAGVTVAGVTVAGVTVAGVTVAGVTVAGVTVAGVTVATVAVLPWVARGLVVHRRRARGRLLRRAGVRLPRRLAVVVMVVVMRLRVTRVIGRVETASEEGKGFTLGQQFAELGIQLKQAKLRHYKSPSS